MHRQKKEASLIHQAPDAAAAVAVPVKKQSHSHKTTITQKLCAGWRMCYFDYAALLQRTLLLLAAVCICCLILLLAGCMSPLKCFAHLACPHTLPSFAPYAHIVNCSTSRTHVRDMCPTNLISSMHNRIPHHDVHRHFLFNKFFHIMQKTKALQLMQITIILYLVVAVAAIMEFPRAAELLS